MPPGPIQVRVTTTESAARVGEDICFIIQVGNSGDRPLDDVTVEVPLAVNTLLVSACFLNAGNPRRPSGEILLEGHKVLFQAGTLSAGELARARLLLRPRVPGKVRVMPSATCAQIPVPVFCRPAATVEVASLGEEMVRRCAPAGRWIGAAAVLPLLAACRLISTRRRAARARAGVSAA